MDNRPIGVYDSGFGGLSVWRELCRLLPNESIIYLGDGKIIHSSHMVRINSLIPGEEDYYENAWKMVAAVRL